MSNPARETSTSEFTPEEAALLKRLRVFVNMRWLAILGIIVATLVAFFVFDISFPTLPVYIVCAFMALYNLIFLLQLRGLSRDQVGSVIPKARTYSYIHIFLDLVAMTTILHFTGGIENPFLFYFVFHIILASIALPYITVYWLATTAVVMFTLVVMLEYFGIWTHQNLTGFAPAGRYQQVSYIVAVLASLATILYGSTYMASAISGELRKRQREVVQLRDRLLQEKTTELEQSSREIAKLEEERNKFLRFIGVAAHDLKAPLAAIQSYIGVMLGGFAGEIGDKQKQMLQRSSVRIDELLKLISDLLDIPRIETGQIVPEMKEVSLGQVIRDCLPDQQRLAEEKGLKLWIDLPGASLEVYGSAPRLQQVIINLLTNAVNYTTEGTVQLHAKELDNEIQIEITDTGIGIPSQDIPHIFDDFFRASNVEAKKGTGLGLSISKRIVEAHGGKIWVESPCPGSNQGCRFTFTVPKKSSRRQP